jgi:NAD+ synthase
MQTHQHTALQLAEEISAWLKGHLERSGADRFVLGLSGGIDSAVVAGLAARGVGSDRVLGVMMPSSSNPDDLHSAQLVAAAFSIPTITVDLTGVSSAFLATLPSPDTVRESLSLETPVPAGAERLANANLKPRLRMTTLYYVANLCRGMVLGTGNKSESMIGYFTKYGDGGVDVKPISTLYKHEVRAVAREIGVPAHVIERPPSAGLWAGQTDEEEIGITYEVLDRTLQAIESGQTAGTDQTVVDKVERMIRSSDHKRRPVPEFERS